LTKPFEIGQDGLLKTALDDPVVLSGGSWDELRLFLAVAKLGSFARAGDYLGLSTATIARQVKRLQDRLRTQLIVPGRTGSRLTEDGAALAKALADLDHKLFSIASNLRADNKHVEGVVRVSVTEGLAGVFLASKLAEFHSKWPGIAIHLKTPINVTSLRENRADLMVGFEPVQASDISSRPLGFLHLIPIASESYLKSRGMPVEDNLPHHIFVDSQFYQAKTGMWADWHRVIGQGQVAANCDSSLSYASAVLGGLGIGLLGNYTLSTNTLRHVGLGIHVRVPLFLQGLAERLEARPVQVVTRWLMQTFGTENPWFSEELNLRPENPTQFLAVMGALLGASTNIGR
jgi:DNA-binding transcriptional LysR family regulator